MMEKEKLSVYVEPEVYEKMKAKAKKMGLTMNGLVNVCISDYLKQDEALDYMKFVDQLRNLAEKNIKPGE